MDRIAHRARLRMDLRERRKRVPRVVLYGAMALSVVLLGTLAPGAVAWVDLGFRWLLVLVWTGFSVVFWNIPGRIWRMPPRLVFVTLAAGFLAIAIAKTHAALG